jgi:hypothetical protein
MMLDSGNDTRDEPLKEHAEKQETAMIRNWTRSQVETDGLRSIREDGRKR